MSGDTTVNARIVAICNQKGGVGKTTTTYHLGRAAVLAGKRVLFVDLDPQGNLTTYVAAPEAVVSGQVGLADVLSDRSDDVIQDVIVPSLWEGAELVPTIGPSLSVVRDELITRAFARETQVKLALDSVAADYDLILIDCAPSLDQLTINALTSADEVLIVTEPALLSHAGLTQLMQTVSGVRKHLNASLTVAGIIVNNVEESTVNARLWLEQLQVVAEENELTLLQPPIPKAVAIKDSCEAGEGLDQWGERRARRIANIYDSYLDAVFGGAA